VQRCIYGAKLEEINDIYFVSENIKSN